MTTINISELQQTIQQVRVNCAATEAALQAIVDSPVQCQYVIMWGDGPLRTDGKKVGMFGPMIYKGPRHMMKQEAEHFAVKAEGTPYPMPVYVTSAYEALAAVKATNTKLLTQMEEAVAKIAA